jgi:hypothetical protein
MPTALLLAFMFVAHPSGEQRGFVSGINVRTGSATAEAPVVLTIRGTNPCEAVHVDFGDGNRGTFPIERVPATITHEYTRPGTYRVRAHGANNCDGEALATVNVSGAQGSVQPEPMRFSGIDRNGDRVISPAEWPGARRSFYELDANGDGVLSRREYAAARDEGVDVIEDVGRRVLRVSAMEDWTDTGVEVLRGDTLVHQATGRVRLSDDQSDVAPPAGSLSGRRAPNAPLSHEPAGALIARIGDSELFLVRTARTITAPATGRLYLGVNDDHFADNAGEFRVTIDVQRRTTSR